MDPDVHKPAPAAQASPDSLPALPTATATPQPAVTAASLFEAENPRLAGRPETAPAYDQMRQVRQMPQAVAFIANRHTCHAYTQQGTRIQMSEQQCREEMNAPRFCGQNRAHADAKRAGQRHPDAGRQLAQAEHV
ncbi:hypothetical protein LQD23_19690 [Chromobacterium violaceum]|uniref:hypothetical protein n=1 Tax=Chromobacterium violaceum TaxID=536 RepID=UPI001E4784BD|nr:hypothetical protein [Chromobacterium violaceum]MCD0494502.1 hypothetical protein [Chromobacterium violaceum]